jgi:hypothetical protein
MVDSAAAIWSNVPTAAIALTDAGSLAEDVNGSNVQAGIGLTFAAPADVTPAATGTPIAVIFDADGSVLNALEGQGASEPDNCQQNAVLAWIDTMQPDATLAHGVILLNGLCATSPNLLAMMSYQLQRAFGEALGLDFSLVNDNAMSLGVNATNAALAWPIMQPLNRQCGPSGGTCIPNPGSLRFDDIATLSRLYPVTTANLNSLPGKSLTAANTVSIQGTINFRSGQGMQGVNVVARPLDANGSPLYQYTVTFVSGSYFAGNRGNAVTGWTDSLGNRLDRFGGSDPAMEGFFDLSGIPLPHGVTSANYELTFEAVNPLYIDPIAVGPYLMGSPTPSGTIAPITINSLQAGSAQMLSVDVANSAFSSERFLAPAPIVDPAWNTPNLSRENFRSANVGTEANPSLLPASGNWTSRLGQVGIGDWLIFPALGNRILTIVAQALDSSGLPTWSKAMPAIGVWDGFDPIETPSAGFAAAANGIAPGETWLQVATSSTDMVRIGIADQRGDGRPDYLYRGWVLYAASVAPTRIPASGGTIVIHGMGFRSGDTVKVGGAAATVTSISSTEITAAVAPSAPGINGSQDVEVDDLPAFNAIAVIPGGISYDSGTGDVLHLITAPANQIPINIPQSFSVAAETTNGKPAGGVTVTYTVTSGTTVLGCGQSSCSVTTSGDGRATMTVTATSTTAAIVTASLNNGASLQAHFFGGQAAALTSLSPTLFLAAGATLQWPVQVRAQAGGVPSPGQSVIWRSAPGIQAPVTAVATDATGTASATLTVGPLAEGQTATTTACVAGTSQCVTLSAFGSRPEFATLTAVTGTSQSIVVGTTPVPVLLRVLDMDGNPMAGGTVTLHQALYAWSPPCPPHGRCAQAQLLSRQTSVLTSALDGSVSATPLTLPGIATNLAGIATTGTTATLKFSIEIHP